MKITFICSSLEPGRDGVGDYTRVLGAALTDRGHAVQLVALHDRHVRTAAQSGGGGTAALRLPASAAWSTRVAAARRFVDDFAPDWVSVQFVAYGFQDRGHVFGLGPRLRAIAAGRPRHLMFHELWTGGRGATLRQRAEGIVQKQLTLRFARDLAPAVVHTHAPPYVVMLRRERIDARRLPLFGNIVPQPNGDRRWLHAAFERAGVTAAGANRMWAFGLFGTIHPEWTPEPLLPRLITAAAANGRTPVLLAIGRLGAAGERKWEAIRASCGRTIRCVMLGELAPERLSQALQALDFGIATSPLALIGKSSTAATLLDHGIPVIVSRDDVVYSFPYDRLEASEPLLLPLGADLFERLAAARRRPAASSLDPVAEQLIADLEASRP